jgi:hypothetical protein
MGSNLSWVFNNIPPDGDGYGWRGFFAGDIIKMSESDFYVIFPEKKIQEERDKKLNELLK